MTGGTNRRNLLLAFALLPAVPILLYLRVWPGLGEALALRTTLLHLFMFVLALPATWLVTRTILGLFGGVFSTALFLELALFPLWPFIGDKAAKAFHLTEVTFWGGLNIRWLLLVFVLLALAAACGVHRRRRGSWFPHLRGTENARRRTILFVLLLFLLLSLPQMLFRFGNYTPLGEERIPEGHKFVAPDFHGFYGIGYSSCDVLQHVGPGCFYAGNCESMNDMNWGVCNDRPTAGYFYHLLSYYFHPYMAARLLLFVFYFLIIASGYLFALDAGMSQLKAVSLGLVLMSCHYLLANATILNIYIHFYGSQPILLYCLYRTGFFKGRCSWSEFLMYCALTTLFAVGYFPYIFSIFHGFCLLGFMLLHRADYLGRAAGLLRSPRFLAMLLLLLLAPIAVKSGWMATLGHYDLQGSDDNRDVGRHYMEKTKELPGYALEHPGRVLKEFGAASVKLVTNYAIYTHATPYAFWVALQILGLLALPFLPWLLPKASRDTIVLLYAFFGGFFFVSLLSGVTSVIWPHPKWDGALPLTPSRANGAYFTVLFGQIAGLSFLFALAARGLRCLSPKLGALSADRLLLGAAACIHVASFIGVYRVWSAYHETYPMFQGAGLLW